jgi:hypothetical protein
MCLFVKKIIILTTFVCCPASVLYTVLTVIRLGQGLMKAEAGHQVKEARVLLCFTKRFIGLLMEI